MLGKTKEISSRYGAPTDFMRIVNKGFELLSSNSPDSDHELLELVKKAKREGEKDALPHPKKNRTGRAPGEMSDAQSLSHRSSSSSEHAASGSDPAAGNTSTLSTQASATSIGQAQARLMNVIRAGSGRGRGDKVKRKANR